MRRKARRAPRLVDGDNFLFRLFQEILEVNTEVADQVVDLVVGSAAIWFPPNVYKAMPVLLPWVVRDAKCRPHTKGGIRYPDQWAAPDEHGFLRDDNSLIKGIPKSLSILSDTNDHLDGYRLGKSWVAAHVWREVNLERLASRDPRLNSFVPNLVWLPQQIAKLSDQEGSLLQIALKRASWSIYRNLEVNEAVRDEVEKIWSLLPQAEDSSRPFAGTFNFFDAHEKFLKSRSVSLRTTTRLLSRILNDGELPAKGRTPPRYYHGIQKLPSKKLETLSAFLEPYERAIVEELKILGKSV